MAIKLKNITKTKKLYVLRSKKKSISILTYISVFILIITGILLILFARNGIYRDALSETEYGLHTQDRYAKILKKYAATKTMPLTVRKRVRKWAGIFLICMQKYI